MSSHYDDAAARLLSGPASDGIAAVWTVAVGSANMTWSTRLELAA